MKTSVKECIVVALVCSVATFAQAEADPHAHHRAQMEQKTNKAIQAKPTQVTLLEANVVDQNGKEQKFRSDVIGNKLVAINVMYTSCTTVCPVTSALFSQLQDKLGDRLGSEVRLVSVSVDPVTDTPSALREYAKKMSARPGWFWLTGQKRAIDELLDGLGAYAADFRDHPAVVLIGDPSTNAWRRFYGFPGPDAMLEVIDTLAEQRSAQGDV